MRSPSATPPEASYSHDPVLEAALRESRRITRAHGTSYFLASRFLNPEHRDAIYALYAFVRVADDIVDVLPPNADTSDRDPAVRLTAFEARWEQAKREGRSDDPVLHAAAWVVKTYGIPDEEIQAFLSAMRQDLTQTRYAAYAELEGYMYGSAAVVGRMLTRIFGYTDIAAFPYAQDLGNAMQLTNFLRDMRDDYETRGRIYLPQEDLERFGVVEADIASHRVSPEFIALMKFEIARARELYDRSQNGIPLLSAEARPAVALARVLYEKILDQIEAAEYDVFTERRRVSNARKAWYALPALWSRYVPISPFSHA